MPHQYLHKTAPVGHVRPALFIVIGHATFVQVIACLSKSILNAVPPTLLKLQWVYDLQDVIYKEPVRMPPRLVWSINYEYDNCKHVLTILNTWTSKIATVCF